jgi:nitrate reductase NapE component
VGKVTTKLNTMIRKKRPSRRPLYHRRIQESEKTEEIIWLAVLAITLWFFLGTIIK